MNFTDSHNISTGGVLKCSVVWNRRVQVGESLPQKKTNTIQDVSSTVVIWFSSADGPFSRHYSLIIWAGLICCLIFIASRVLITNLMAVNVHDQDGKNKKASPETFEPFFSWVQITAPREIGSYFLFIQIDLAPEMEHSAETEKEPKGKHPKSSAAKTAKRCIKRTLRLLVLKTKSSQFARPLNWLTGLIALAY